MRRIEQRNCLATLLVAICALAGAAAQAEVHATDEFESGATRPVSVALLPAHVVLMKQKMIRRSNEVEEAGELEGHLTAAVASELTARGYDVRVLDANAISADARLQELVVDADRRYAETLTNIMSRISKKRVTRREYNAGDSMKLLASHLGVDGVAFVRMDVVAAGKAVQALNFGIGGTQTMMNVSFIDGTSADIEAYVTLPVMRRGKLAGGYEDMMKDPDVEMARYASATLDDLPFADRSARASQSDDDVLSDLEGLLQ